MDGGGPLVGGGMGSDSDWPAMAAAAAVLAESGARFEAAVVSAHRMPNEMISYGSGAGARSLRAIMSASGGGAPLSAWPCGQR